MKCVKVEKKDAEKVKQELIKKKALSRNHKSVVGKKYIYFPITKEVKKYTIVNKDCEELVREKVDISSYDQIGDIIIVQEGTSKETAEKIIRTTRAKVVLIKKGIHKGEFRTQDLDFLAGEKRKETLYKENGIQLKLNVETSYFSPRLSTERRRVADLIKKGEKILVLFSGVAPYPLVLAKHSLAELIIGVEKNPEAHKYALENCKKYKNIALFNMDAKDFSYKEKFDRVLMPLPKSAEDFLEIAKANLKKGGMIHFYDFLFEQNIPEGSLKKIRKKLKKFTLVKTIKCGQASPRKWRVCLDIKV